MAPKIIACLLTFAVNVAVGVMIFFVLLIAMNGYSENDAMFGLIAYIVMAVLVTILMSVFAFLLAGRLQRKEYGAVATVLISASVFSIAGIALKIIFGLVGVGMAEFMRVNF